MRAFIVFFTILLFSSTVSAAPFFSCDPSKQAIGLSYEIYHGDKLMYSGENQPDGSISVDLKAIPVGDYELRCRYVKKATGKTSELSVIAYIHATPYYITWTSCKPETVKIKRK